MKRLIPFGIKDALYLGSQPGQPARQDYYGLIAEQSISIQPAKDWKDLARRSDILIVGAALSPATKHMVNAEFLSLMPKRGVVVNIARG